MAYQNNTYVGKSDAPKTQNLSVHSIARHKSRSPRDLPLGRVAIGVLPSEADVPNVAGAVLLGVGRGPGRSLITALCCNDGGQQLLTSTKVVMNISLAIFAISSILPSDATTYGQ